MQNSLGHVNAEFFSLASQLYVRMRRLHGRVIDSVYMTQNPDYAREILRLAQTSADAELSGLIQRIEQFVPATANNVALLKQAGHDPAGPTGNAATAQQSSPVVDKYSQEQTAHHYVGSLR